MTRTEERLADALHASVDRVRDDRLHPLPVLEPAAEPLARRPWAAWRPWLVPVAAAASVALIIGLAVDVTRGPQQIKPGSPGGSGATAAAFPTYFVETAYLGGNVNIVQVRSTSTGSVVASARTPKVPGWTLRLDVMGAGPGGHTG